MRFLEHAFRRPQSVLAGSAVALFAVMLVLLNLPLASCESFDMAREWLGTEEGSAAGEGGASTRRPGLPSTDAEEAEAAALRKAVPLGGLAGIDREPEMRVRVKAGAESVEISAAAGSVLSVGPVAQTQPRGDWAEGWTGQAVQGPVRVSVEGGEWVVAGSPGAAVRFPATADLGIEPAGGGAGSKAGAIRLDGAEFPGRLRLRARSDTSARAFDVIEHVPLETYLPGVVAKELMADWPLEAYRVQAICARSYALQERARSRAAGEAYDVEAGERDQAYAGATQHRYAGPAVRGTRGVVLSYQGRVLRAYYSSTCGGRTASAADTWPTSRGFEYNLDSPIQAHTRRSACEASPLFRWSVTRDRAELVRRMKAFGARQGLLIKQIKDLAGVEVMQRNADGRPSRYKVIEPGGTWYQVSAEELRLACNQSVPPEQGPAIDRKTRVASGDLEIAVSGANVTITGRGFGHGVGMCQFCTNAMVRKGETWQTLLPRFYPGVSVVRAYE